jgi:hypothetical protein
MAELAIQIAHFQNPESGCFLLLNSESLFEKGFLVLFTPIFSARGRIATESKAES